jgi:hypothetical protein
MPTTIDQFFAIVQIAQTLSMIHNQMRANTQGIKTSHDAPAATVLTTVATAYVAGSGTLVVADGTATAAGNTLIGLNNALHTVLRVTAKAGNTLTVVAKQNDQAAAVGVQLRSVSNLFEDFPATQLALRDLGKAFNQLLAKNQTVYDTYPAEVQAGAVGVGIVPGEVGTDQTLLVTWASNLETAVVTTQTQLDALVTAVLANVPQAMQPF